MKMSNGSSFRSLIVGGHSVKPDSESGIVRKLSEHLKIDKVFNSKMPPETAGFTSEFDVILWMPDIPNLFPKIYPRKKAGAILICSKVMRPDTSDADAVSRIFKMHGNAVIKIYKDVMPYQFQLTDALGNDWTDRISDLKELANVIRDFCWWSNGQIRRSLSPMGRQPFQTKIDPLFVQMNKSLSKKVATQCGNRFFGNYSTRCVHLFPSKRMENTDFYLFSPRNVNKGEITEKDFVMCSKYGYFEDRKPSVDTPMQIEIYEWFGFINYMIHGHAYISQAPKTSHYYPCGDLRETPLVLELLEKGFQQINLRNHGFLIVASTLEEMSRLIEFSRFTPSWNDTIG